MVIRGSWKYLKETVGGHSEVNTVIAIQTGENWRKSNSGYEVAEILAILFLWQCSQKKIDLMSWWISGRNAESANFLKNVVLYYIDR